MRPRNLRAIKNRQGTDPMPVALHKNIIGCRDNRQKEYYSMHTSAYTCTSDNTSPSFSRTSESPPVLSELRAYYTYLSTMSMVFWRDSAKNMNKTINSHIVLCQYSSRKLCLTPSFL